MGRSRLRVAIVTVMLTTLGAPVIAQPIQKQHQNQNGNVAYRGSIKEHLKDHGVTCDRCTLEQMEQLHNVMHPEFHEPASKVRGLHFQPLNPLAPPKLQVLNSSDGIYQHVTTSDGPVQNEQFRGACGVVRRVGSFSPLPLVQGFQQCQNREECQLKSVTDGQYTTASSAVRLEAFPSLPQYQNVYVNSAKRQLFNRKR
jgi:hypothetical protein